MGKSLSVSMAKIEINQVAGNFFKRNKVESALLRSVVEEMNLLAQAAQGRPTKISPRPSRSRTSS